MNKNPSENSTETAADTDRTVLRVIAGNPTPEEVAAVTVVLTLVGQAPEPVADPTPVGGWADPSLRLHRALPPGPGAWRASAWR